MRKIIFALYKSCVCVVSIKQAWCIAVITSGNNTILLEISFSREKPESGHPGLFRRTVRIPVHQRT